MMESYAGRDGGNGHRNGQGAVAMPRRGASGAGGADARWAQAAATVLLVDDAEMTRYALGRMLRAAGFEVREAGDGATALREAPRADLVILDVNLPDMSGFEVCQRLRADPATAMLPVLHMSASLVGGHSRILGLDSGADGYLTHPVEPGELVATVKALLRTRRAEEAARASARQWQTAFDAISDAVALADGEGRLVRANRAMAALLGGAAPEGALLGELLAVALGVGAAEVEPITRLCAATSREAVELRLGRRWLRVTVDPVPGEPGGAKSGGAAFIVSDVTERKELEEALQKKADALQESDERKDEFLAMLAHELRNPLGAIRFALHLLDGNTRDPARARRLHQTCNRQVAHLARLVDDLIDVARITRGHIELRRERVSLTAVVAQAVDASRSLLDSRRHSLDLQLADDDLYIDGDPTRLEQIIVNLLDNAAKYTEPGGCIRVVVARNGDGAVVRVRDNGIGIPRDVMPQIFDLFAQADKSLDRTRGGLGIGLTLVKKLMDLHGGTITATSDGDEQGSEFVVRFPLAPEAEAEDAAAAAGGGTAPARPLRVLLVDDNDDGRETLRDILELLGHEVEVARDGHQGVERALSLRPDVALIDIGLPGLDGYEVARQVRQDGTRADMYLVAVTGYGQPRDRALAREAGFDLHMVKPVDPKELMEVLERLQHAAPPSVALPTPSPLTALP